MMAEYRTVAREYKGELATMTIEKTYTLENPSVDPFVSLSVTRIGDNCSEMITMDNMGILKELGEAIIDFVKWEGGDHE